MILHIPRVRPAVRAILRRALAGQPPSLQEGTLLLQCLPEEEPALFEAAGEVRDRLKGRRVTYSRKVFLPLTNLCRDRCAYCTFRKSPRQAGAHTMAFEEVRQQCRRARARRCREALMCLGDRPEEVYPSHRQTLRLLGVASTPEHIYRACQVALQEGLLPHTNAGLLTGPEMERLKEVNVSMGLMLECISPRLRQKGQAHAAAPTKDPGRRLAAIRLAGELRIPFTSGILVGIGETAEERVASLQALVELHRELGHIQEVIVQNFRAKPDVPMAGAAEPPAREVARTVAVARLLLQDMNLQAPPNLNPGHHRLLLAAGINDWGGISPLTLDYINPEAPWPHLEELAATCARAGFQLAERLAIYPEYIEGPGWLHPALQEPTRRALEEMA